MFDKTKARVTKLEETNDDFRKVMTHLRENKKMYVGVGIGVAGTLIVKNSPLHINNTVAPVIAPEMTNVVNNIVVQALGDPGDVVKCLETGTIYASKGQAARELGVAAARITEQLNGKLPHVNGRTFEFLGKAGHPLA